MKTYRTILSLFVFLLTALPGISQEKNPSTPFFFIQVTDPQFGMYESDKGFSKETELYEKAVMEINRLEPDFVVITGDLVNNKNNRSQVAEFKRITAKIGQQIPVYYSPGNHDIGQSPEQKDIDIFIADYEHDRFSFMHKKTLFVGINSCLVKSNTSALEEKQFKWLKKVLTKGKKSEQIIVFSHYPFFIKSYDEPENYSNISTEIRNRYLGLFKKHNVDAVFAGHLHNNASAMYGEMEMVTTSAVGKPLADVPSGLRIVKVYSDRIESDYYSLDELPEKVTFK